MTILLTKQKYVKFSNIIKEAIYFLAQYRKGMLLFIGLLTTGYCNWYSSTHLTRPHPSAVKKWLYKRCGISRKGKFSSILRSKCILILA